MTLTEKILAKHSDNTRLQPGANIWTNVDKLLTHDVCGPGTFGIFEKEFGAGAASIPSVCRAKFFTLHSHTTKILHATA